MRFAQSSRGIVMSIEALLSLVSLIAVLAVLPVTDNAYEPGYGIVYKYQVLEDVMEISAKKPSLDVGVVSLELGYCVEIDGQGCSCENKESVSTTRIVPSGAGFRRIVARLCKE